MITSLFSNCSLFSLFQVLLLALVASALSQNCDTNMVVVICKPSVVNNSSKLNMILPPELGIRHQRTIKLGETINRQIQQTVVLLKSIVITTKYSQSFTKNLFPKPCVNFIIVGKDPGILEELENEIELENWDSEFRSLLRLSFIQAKYPSGMEWMENFYRQCATLTLFLPELLPDDIKQIVYVDTDTIFLRPPSTLQNGFKYFNRNQLIAIAPQLKITNSTKTIEKQEIFCKNRNLMFIPQSYNVGVMLMDLEKMRQSKWSSKLGIVAELVLNQSYYGVQDVLILYFQHNNHELMDLSCHWNYLPKHCQTNCGHDEGISIVHGSVGSFFFPPGSPYEVLFKFYQEYSISQAGNITITEFNKRLGDRMWNCVNKLNKLKLKNRNSNNSSLTSFAETLMKSMEELENPNRQIKLEILFSTKPSSFQQIKIKGNFFEKQKTLTFPEINRFKSKSTKNKTIVIAVTFVEVLRKGKKNYNKQLILLTAMLKSVLLSKKEENETMTNNITLVTITNNGSNCQTIYLTINSLNPEQLNFECIVGDYTEEFLWLIKVFKPGVWLRLVYPDVIPYDAAIHIDNDIIFRKSITHLWSNFDRFQANQILGAARQLSDPEAKNSEYPITSYQAGIMLMNLTRMREIGWGNQLQMMTKILKDRFLQKPMKLLPIQTLLHIYFKYHPEQIFELETGWNFLPHYCGPDSELRFSPIYAIHGVNNSFTRFDTMEPLFRHIFLETLKHTSKSLSLKFLDTKAIIQNFSSLCAQSLHFRKEWLGLRDEELYNISRTIVV